MEIYQPLDILPIWGVFLFSIALLMVSEEAGLHFGQWVEKRWHDASEANVGTMVGASLAFLGFLLAFVTGIAVTLFNERLNLVITEADAIGTTYLRTDFLPEPYASESRTLLREYTDQRLIALEPGRLQEAKVRSEQIHDELWKRAVVAAELDPSPIKATYIASLNEMIDLHARRIKIALGVRVPPMILLGVLLVAALTMLLVGLHAAYSGKRNVVATLIVVTILAAVFVIVVDLDRSTQGLIRVPQQAMYDLQQQLNR